MRTASQRIAQVSLCLALALGWANLSIRAQYAEQYIISAKAGGVNLISGSVSVLRRGEKDWRPLVPKSVATEDAGKKDRDNLSREREAVGSGDQVRTEATGRFEVLLNPGSYLRLAENSQIEFIDAQLDSLRIKLIKGNAIVEVTGSSDITVLTEIITPQTTIAIVRTGLYRINVTPAGTTELVVSKGRAVVGTGELVTVKGGKKITVAGGAINVAKFDKKNQDSFDFWSKSRAETLVAANNRLSDRELSHAILNSGLRPMRSGTGLWVYDPFLQSHTFFPYYSGWNSPYGHGYHSSFGYSSDWYRPSQPTSASNPQQPVGNNPSVGGSSPERQSIRERKNQIRDELPIRPVESEMRGHKSERQDSSPRERSNGGFQNNRRDDSFRNSSPSPRQEPSYNPPSPPPARERSMPEDSGGRGRKTSPLK
ncbi:MAG: FecR family protein [Pyrinomonadaceae bacterium]